MISPKFDLPANINISCAVEAQYYVASLIPGSYSADLRVGVTDSSTNVASSYTTHAVKGNNNTGEKFSAYTTDLTLTGTNPYVSLHHNSPSKPGGAAWWYLNVGIVSINYR